MQVDVHWIIYMAIPNYKKPSPDQDVAVKGEQFQTIRGVKASNVPR